jgi:hypothetical protein
VWLNIDELESNLMPVEHQFDNQTTSQQIKSLTGLGAQEIEEVDLFLVIDNGDQPIIITPLP